MLNLHAFAESIPRLRTEAGQTCAVMWIDNENKKAWLWWGRSSAAHPGEPGVPTITDEPIPSRRMSLA